MAVKIVREKNTPKNAVLKFDSEKKQLYFAVNEERDYNIKGTVGAL